MRGAFGFTVALFLASTAPFAAARQAPALRTVPNCHAPSYGDPSFSNAKNALQLQGFSVAAVDRTGATIAAPDNAAIVLWQMPMAGSQRNPSETVKLVLDTPVASPSGDGTIPDFGEVINGPGSTRVYKYDTLNKMAAAAWDAGLWTLKWHSPTTYADELFLSSVNPDKILTVPLAGAGVRNCGHNPSKRKRAKGGDVAVIFPGKMYGTLFLEAITDPAVLLAAGVGVAAGLAVGRTISWRDAGRGILYAAAAFILTVILAAAFVASLGVAR